MAKFARSMLTAHFIWRSVESVAQQRKVFRVSEIRRLARLQCTDREAAGVLGISVRTFQDMIRYDEAARDAWESGMQHGRVTLRRTQFRLSEKNATMAIFLGKQMLGQRDIMVSEITGRDGGPVQTLDLKKLSDDDLKKLIKIVQVARPDRGSAEISGDDGPRGALEAGMAGTEREEAP